MLVLGQVGEVIKNEYTIKTMTNISVELVWFRSQYAKQNIVAFIHC